MFKSTCLAATLIVAGVSSVSAETITVSRSIDYTNPDGEFGTTLKAFDSTRGKLTGATLHLFGTYTGSFSIPVTYIPAGGSGTVTDIIDISSPSILSSYNTEHTVNYSSTGQATSSLPIDLTYSYDASAFKVLQDVSVSVRLDVGTNAGAGTSQVGTYGFSGVEQILYTFTPVGSTAVPEPASLAVLGAASLGMVAMRRRRRI